jgi:hypothetical protein
MRAIDLALYADELAAEASALAARLERARARLRRAALEREARRALDGTTVTRLEASGVLGAAGSEPGRDELATLAETLSAVEELQAWVEARLYTATTDDEESGVVTMID